MCSSSLNLEGNSDELETQATVDSSGPSLEVDVSAPPASRKPPGASVLLKVGLANLVANAPFCRATTATRR